MNQQKIEITLIWVIKVCLILVVFAPLLILGDYFFPAIFPKAIYIRLLTEIAIVAYVPLAIISPKFRPKYHIVYALLFLFGIVVLLTSITGESFNFSFWGNYERMDGLFSWLHSWAIILVAASVLRTKKEWLVLLSFSVFAALLMSGYGFMQRVGVEQFLWWTIFETNLGRITGTIGNPAFFGVYLLFNILFGLLIVIEKSISKWWRFVVGVALFPIFGAYIMSGVRGAFVGLVVGVVCFFFGTLLWNQNKQIKSLVAQGFVGFVSVLGLLYFYIGRNDWITSNFRRLFSYDLADSTIQTRLLSWRGGFTGFIDNFWLGVGPQKYDVVFNKHFNPEFYSLVGNETWWDRAHNMVVEVAATTGIFGLLTYLGVGLALVYSLWYVGQKDNERRIESLIIMCFFIAYFIQNLFVFDTTSSYLVLSILVGYVIAQTYAQTHIGERFRVVMFEATKQLRDLLPPIQTRHWWIGLVVITAIMAPIAYSGNIKLIKHNKMFLMTLAYGYTQPFDITMANYKDVFETSNFDNREVGIKLSQYIGQKALSGELTVAQLQTGYTFTINTLDQVLEQNPKDARLLLSYGNAVNIYGELLKQYNGEQALRVLQKAERILLEAVSLSTSRQQVLHSLANTYLIAGATQKGIETLQKTVDLYPENPKTYWILAFAYLQANQINLAIEASDSAVKNGYIFPDEASAQQIANILVEHKRYELLLRLYEKVHKDTGTASSLTRVAAVQAQMGQKENAIISAKEVARMKPELKSDVDDFIKKVETSANINFLN